MSGTWIRAQTSRRTDNRHRSDIQADVEGFSGKGHSAIKGWSAAVAEYEKLYNQGEIQAFDRIE